MSQFLLFDPMKPKCLTVRQPWADLIARGIKTIENRTWQTHHRGEIYIHAGSKLHITPISTIEKKHQLQIDRGSLVFGAIIARVNLVDIVSKSSSPYFTGPFGWVFDDIEAIEPIPCLGTMGLFNLPNDIKLPSNR